MAEVNYTIRKATLPLIIFASIIFGLLWGLLESLLVAVQGRIDGLSEGFFGQILVLFSFVLNKVFISFLLGLLTFFSAKITKQIKGIRRLFSIHFMHYLFFLCYFCIYYSVRIMVPHGYIISLELGLIAALTVILIMFIARLFVSYISYRVIRRLVMITLPVFICILLLVFIDYFAQLDKQVVYNPSGTKGFEDISHEVNTRLNIVFVLVDALRQDHMHNYGYMRNNTPFIDEFVKNCITFNNCRAVATETTKSIASLFTGKYPASTGTQNSYWLNDDNFTIAEYLKSIGYKTALITANVKISKKFNFNQGFDYISKGTDAGSLYNEFLKVLPELSSTHFFTFMHFMETHTQYDIEDRFLEHFIDDDYVDDMPLKFRTNQTSSFGGFSGDPFPDRRFDTQGQYIALYDATILQADYYFKKIVETLKNKGLYDNTVIIFSSDHGEFMGDWDLFCVHGGIPYSPLTDIPLLIKYNDTYVNFDDVLENRNTFRIILDLMNKEPSKKAEVQKLLSNHCHGYAVSQRGHFSSVRYGFSIEDNDHKYILNSKGLSIKDVIAFPEGIWQWKVRELLVSRDYFNYLYKEQFYDLPDEKRNNLGSLDGHNFPHTLVKGLRTVSRKETRKTELDEETREKLRSLGYIR